MTSSACQPLPNPDIEPSSLAAHARSRYGVRAATNASKDVNPSPCLQPARGVPFWTDWVPGYVLLLQRARRNLVAAVWMY